MSAQLLKQELDVTVSGGFKQYQITRTYQVFSSSRTEGPVSIIGTVGIPEVGSTAIVDGVYVSCTNVRAVQPQPLEAATRWEVMATYSNQTQSFLRDEQGLPITEPEQSVKQVSITFQEMVEPVRDAKLISITEGPYWDVATTFAVPTWLASAVTKPSVITNSGGYPVIAEKSVYRKMISVHKYVTDWVNTWDSYLGSTNSDSVTITQRDSNGVRLSQTFAVDTLLMQDVIKEDVWKDAKLYFRVGFVMAYNPNTWIHSEPDHGTKRRIFVGQKKASGGTYSAGDLTDANILGAYGPQEITTTTKQPDGSIVETTIGEPVRLNGYGMEMPVTQATAYNADAMIYLNYRKFPQLAFSTLGL